MNLIKQNIITLLRGIRSLSKTHVFIILFGLVAGIKLCYDYWLPKKDFERKEKEELLSIVGTRWPWRSFQFKETGFIASNHEEKKIVFGKDFYESLKGKKDYFRFYLLHEISHIPQILWASFLIYLAALLSRPHHSLEKFRLYLFFLSLIVGMAMESNADISACEEFSSTETCLSAMDFLDQKLRPADRFFSVVNFNPHPPVFIRKSLLRFFTE